MFASVYIGHTAWAIYVDHGDTIAMPSPLRPTKRSDGCYFENEAAPKPPRNAATMDIYSLKLKPPFRASVTMSIMNPKANKLMSTILTKFCGKRLCLSSPKDPSLGDGFVK